MTKAQKPKQTKAEKTSAGPTYEVDLVIMGRKYSATGKTLDEAITSLKPGVVNGCSVVNVRRGEASRERILMPQLSRRLFNTHGLSQQIALRNFLMTFEI